MKLNSIFTSHMVFAKGMPIRIFGEGKGTAEITFACQSSLASVFCHAYNYLRQKILILSDRTISKGL